MYIEESKGDKGRLILVSKLEHELNALRRFYTWQEELANVVTHILGLVGSLIAVGWLVWLAWGGGDMWRVVSFAIYGGSLSFVYLTSSIYHSWWPTKTRLFLRKVDHIAIYFLIAGTYTPFMLVSIKGVWGWSVLAFVWFFACVGTIFKLLYIDKFPRVAITMYLLMGWAGVVVFEQFVLLVPMGAMLWLLAGGIIYTLGVVFYVWRQLPYNHAIWHLFVIGGSACHYIAVLFYLLPIPEIS
ncbi:MAG TPA: hemolysin III family protein [Anaerolineae bacterium]|nr:hemolysin III family protein [Anaerolineae bacterium]